MWWKQDRPRHDADIANFRVGILSCAWFLMFMILALTVTSCKGFFIGPTLTTVTVTPSTPSVTVGNTQQMIATGTYDDGNTGDLTDSASWTSSATSVATVSSTGLVKGISEGTSTISATSGAISGSTSVTVTVANLKSISVTPTNYSISSGQTEQFDAIGILQDGTTVDLTSSVTWTSSNTAVATIDSSGLATALTVSKTETTNITAQSGSITSNTAVLTVTTTQ